MTVSPIEITLITEGQEHKVWCDSHEPLGNVVARAIPITEGHGSYVIRHPSGGLVEGFRSVDTHVSGWVNAGFDPKRFFVEVVIDWRARALAAEAKLREVRPDGEARQLAPTPDPPYIKRGGNDLMATTFIPKRSCEGAIPRRVEGMEYQCPHEDCRTVIELHPLMRHENIGEAFKAKCGLDALRAAPPVDGEARPQEKPSEIEMELRREWWLNHGAKCCPYGDDGEMSCCGLDFKRWPLDMLRVRVTALRWQRLAESVAASPGDGAAPPPGIE